MKRIWYRIADYVRETDKIFIILCLASGLFGCVAVFSATNYTESARHFIVQLFCTFVGLAAAIVISLIDYERITRWWYLFAAGSLGLVILTFFIGIAPAGTDDRAWLRLPGGMTFQPAELLKIAFIITFAVHLSRIGDKVNELKHLIPVCAHGALPVLLIHFQGDDGTALVFAIMFVCMLCAAGLKARYFIIAGAAAAVAIPFIFFFVMSPDQQNRLLTIFDLEADIQGTAWQQWRGRAALANGGLFGQGLFNGSLTQMGKAGVPEGYNDFIFTCIGEELGMLGCLAVIILLGAICLRACRTAKVCKNPLGKLMCIGFVGMVAAQSIINIGMCVALLPVIGITLPFFSAGGTSLCCLFLGVGLVLNVYVHRDSRMLYLRS